jgi:hypothetical protein
MTPALSRYLQASCLKREEDKSLWCRSHKIIHKLPTDLREDEGGGEDKNAVKTKK